MDILESLTVDNLESLTEEEIRCLIENLLERLDQLSDPDSEEEKYIGVCLPTAVEKWIDASTGTWWWSVDYDDGEVNCLAWHGISLQRT